MTRVREDLSPLFDLHHRRLYHLSLIRDDVFAEALGAAPQCLKDELFDMITATRKHFADALPFYDYPALSAASSINKRTHTKSSRNSRLDARRIELDWTMRTDRVMDILERDLVMAPGTLAQDCDMLMSAFFSNLWDWFCVSEATWRSLPNLNMF